ncbi:MAG: hypothetical protein FWC40_08940, partial [Proteobacteria bacterium]|nr:hypothetical protein [Pseudomonadota bacterium]
EVAMATSQADAETDEVAMATSQADAETDEVAMATPLTASSWDGNSSLFLVYDLSDGEPGSGLLLGEIKDFQITGFDRNKIFVDGKSLSEGAPKWPSGIVDGRNGWVAESDYSVPGQVLHLYHHKTGKYGGRARITSTSYRMEGSSGVDFLYAKLERIGPSIEAGPYYAISGFIDMNPRNVKTKVKIKKSNRHNCLKADNYFEENENQGCLPDRRVTLTADFDNDGVEEQFIWDTAKANRTEENYLLKTLIHVMRGKTRLTSTVFWSDYDFLASMYPNRPIHDPILLDINGDGVYELILQASKCRAAYVEIYHWVDGAFVKTGALYDGGD